MEMSISCNPLPKLCIFMLILKNLKLLPQPVNTYITFLASRAIYTYHSGILHCYWNLSGAQLNHNREFQITTGLHKTSPSPAAEDNAKNTVENNHVKTKKIPQPSENEARSRFRSDISEDQEMIESDETVSYAKHLDLVGDQIHAEKIVFDRPFYWYLKDEVIGPVFTGLVNSFRTYKEQVVAVEEAFDDMYKYQFWSCAPKHLALMDAYNNAIETQDDEEEDIGLADGLEEAEVNYDDSEK